MFFTISHIAADKFYIEPRDPNCIGDQVLEIDRVSQDLDLAGTWTLLYSSASRSDLGDQASLLRSPVSFWEIAVSYVVFPAVYLQVPVAKRSPKWMYFIMPVLNWFHCSTQNGMWLRHPKGLGFFSLYRQVMRHFHCPQTSPDLLWLSVFIFNFLSRCKPWICVSFDTWPIHCL